MELNITRFFYEACPKDYSASVAEIGATAGKDTWRAACEDSEYYMLLDTDDKRQAFRDYVRTFGAWDDEEIAAWSDIELNALCLQLIAGDIREAGLDTDDPDWEQYEIDAEAGRVSGRLFKSEDDQFYFTIGD